MLRRACLVVASVLMLVVGIPAAAGAVEGGGVVPFGGAPDAGSSRDVDLAARVVGLTATPTGGGYWQVGADGGVRSYGDATFFGSTGAMRLNRPIVGMAASPTGRGYWLVASDGGIFSFGDATFVGSTGGMRLNRPIVGMAASPTGRGYWLVASDGGIFNFGDAPFHGSAGGERLVEPAVGVTTTSTGGGYWIATLDGRVLRYGDAPDNGSLAGRCNDQPVVALAGRRTGGYWLGTSSFLPAAIPPGTHPIDVVAAESANMTTILRVRQGCQPMPAPSRGRFSSPLPGARVTSSYGHRIHPIHRRPQHHTGIDYAGGSRILAAGDGVVAQVSSRQGFGTTTVVDHGDGTATVYAHQAAVAVRAGQRVTRGQAIGTVGRTGYATGNHLHFEVRVHGVPSDPSGWL